MLLLRLTILVLVLACLPAVSAPPVRDPDSPEVHAAARAALSNAKILDVSGRDLAIQPFEEGLADALKDLDAKVTAGEIKIDLDADTLFDPDKSALRPEAVGTMRKLALVVSVNPGSPLSIEGYTEGKGSRAYNVRLSQNRADAVKKWLAANTGLKATSIKTSGLGESKPANNPPGQQKNRVQLTLKNT